MRHSKAYTYFFITIVTIVAATLLSMASSLLKPLQERNEIIEMKKNILIAVGLIQPEEKIAGDNVLKTYDENISSLLIDFQGNLVNTEKTAADINPEAEEDKSAADRIYPVYLQKDGDKVVSYCIPIFGKGLWSTIYGYMALESDLNTIKGVTFYKNGETPGLGAEIGASGFTDNFKGKQIFDAAGNLVSITIAKGKADTGAKHQVDGISGATKTCDGVTHLIKKDLEKYQPYLLSADQR